MEDPANAYIGRFAPSPTGPLHFGSLIAAVASYLDARANNGRWLLRIEDLDPPREPAGAADLIIKQLEALQLTWDGEILYQSARLAAYESALNDLQRRELCYRCSCSRQQIKAMGSVYDGRCREARPEPGMATAVRCRTEPVTLCIDDLVQGAFEQNIASDVGDFVIQRKDGLFAYQLAVVVDDAFQAITHVIRGHDLLDSTPRQVFLQDLLNLPSLTYGHVPVIVNTEGQKLSKQHFAEAIDTGEGRQLLHEALRLLGQNPPRVTEFGGNAEILGWAISHWDIQAVPKLATIEQAESPEA